MRGGGKPKLMGMGNFVCQCRMGKDSINNWNRIYMTACAV